MPLAPHHVDSGVIHPTPDVVLGGVWAASVLMSFPTIVTIITGILAGVYYALVIYDNVARKFKERTKVTKTTVKKTFTPDKDI